MKKSKSVVKNFVNNELKAAFKLINSYISLYASTITCYEEEENYFRSDVNFQKISFKYKISKYEFEKDIKITTYILKDLIKILMSNKKVIVFLYHGKKSNTFLNNFIDKLERDLVHYYSTGCTMKSASIDFRIDKVNIARLYMQLNSIRRGGGIEISLQYRSDSFRQQKKTKYNKDWGFGHKIGKGYSLSDFHKNNIIFIKQNHRHYRSMHELNEKLRNRRLYLLPKTKNTLFFNNCGIVINI